MTKRLMGAMRAFAWSMALLLAACGGGGSDGGGSGSPGGNGQTGGSNGTPSPIVFQAVRVWLEAPLRIEGTFFQDEAFQGVQLQFRADGDVAQLSGRTLYVVVEDPQSIFDTRADMVLQQTPPFGAAIALHGRVLPNAGSFRSSLRIHACLDTACQTELAGSPITVPYDLNVKRGLVTDKDSLAFTVLFGTVPEAQTVNVTLPEGAVDWGGSVSQAGAVEMTVTPSATRAGSATATVAVGLDLASPGTYTQVANVRATVSDNFVPRTFRKAITVTYVVTANASLDYAFNPAAGDYVVAQGDRQGVTVRRTLALNTGIDSAWNAVEYLTNPPAANGHPLVNSWWNDALLYAQTCSGSDCLPAGTYTARSRFSIRKNGVWTTIYWPVTLRIAPP